MNDTPAPSASGNDLIAAAWAMLDRKEPAETIVAALQGIAPGDGRYGQAQHIQGVCASRQGDQARAKACLVEAIRHGDSSYRVWLNLAAVGAKLGLPADVLAMLQDLARRLSPTQLFAFTRQLVEVTGFLVPGQAPIKDVIFDELLVPILKLLLARRDMDAALNLETIIYNHYVKPTETEAHFARVMSRMEPLFTEAGRAIRPTLPPLPPIAMTEPYRIGFFVHNASMLAHIEVLLNTLKGYRLLDDQPFEPIVYCLGGKSPEMAQALAALNVRLVLLDERFPEARTSIWQRLLRLRELLAAEGVQELVWISLVTIMPLAFGLRIAPVQTWYAMKYRNYSQPDIDGYVSGSALTRFATIGGQRFRTGLLGVDDWYDPSFEAEAAAIRASLPATVVLMTLARTEKMRDPAFLGALVALLQRRPETMLVWAGREADPIVVAALREGGVLERTKFVGWVNTRLYVQVADVFIDTFPFPCGFTLFQAMAAGKPVVIYDSPEAAQTGLWNFLQPLIDGDEGTVEERAELRAIVGEADAPGIPIARSPEDYVRQVERLVADSTARADGGAAARRFIARYFSDPRQMGRSYAEHFMELIEQRRADGA